MGGEAGHSVCRRVHYIGYRVGSRNYVSDACPHGIVGMNVRSYFGKLFPQRRYQNGGGTGSQGGCHVLDGKRVNSRVVDISCHLDVILEILIDFVGVRYVPFVREGNLHGATSATGIINADI